MQGFYKANGACGLHEETIFLDANGTRSFFIQRNLNVLQVFHTGKKVKRRILQATLHHCKKNSNIIAELNKTGINKTKMP